MSIQRLHNLQRALSAVLPDGPGRLQDAALLELSAIAVEPPRMKECRVLEGDRVVDHELSGAPEVAFAAFLDGIQESRAVRYAGGVPIVLGRTAAVIRARVSRRMTTWGAGARTALRLYAPRVLLPSEVWDALGRVDLAIVDTQSDAAAAEVAHPHELLRRAVHAVQNDRESIERDLADAWCAAVEAPLYVDGGLPRGERSSLSPWCIGVVKSHHTLYAGGDALRTVLALPEGSRSSVFLVERSWGPSVASWYLRLRDPTGHDPMWGLVRVEVALQEDLTTIKGLKARADDVSRWVLAERSPLSLPDARWATLSYGVHDCEEYLRATSS